MGMHSSGYKCRNASVVPSLDFCFCDVTNQDLPRRDVTRCDLGCVSSVSNLKFGYVCKQLGGTLESNNPVHVDRPISPLFMPMEAEFLAKSGMPTHSSSSRALRHYTIKKKKRCSGHCYFLRSCVGCMLSLPSF